jgi:hypothetical protein
MPYQNKEERTTVQQFIVAACMSLAVLVTGMAWTWKIGQVSNKMAHELAHKQMGLKDLRQYVQKRETRLP